MKKLRPQSFLKNGSPERSVVVGAPADFDFLATLRDATSIKAAIAFGHMSGWSQVGSVLTNSRAENIQILLGQSFLQTEPDVLDSLRKLESAHFHSKLAPTQSTFHPKVWIVESRHTSYTIVGSANLSYGGFADSTECSAYLKSKEAVEAMNNWFSSLWKQGSQLKPELCQAYRERYGKAADARLAAKAAIQQATDELTALEMAWRKEEAIEQARKYFETKDNRDSGERRIAAMEAIRKCLKPRQFSFSKDDWHEFLKISEFGSMKRIRRNTDRHLPLLKKAFAHLADESKPLAARVDAVVPDRGRYHVPGIGMNIATKVLAMLNPDERAVYNERVAKTLRAFGYETNGERTDGELYAKFCRDMKAFVRDCDLPEMLRPEMLSIDSFFEDYSRGIG
jgi:HKD family nuclease